MQKIAFGRTGLQVSCLGFGAAEIGFLKTDRERVSRILHLLLDEGVNLIDTAATYEGAEEVIGQSLEGRRGEYVLVSKCGPKLPDVPGDAFSPELIAATIDRSLRRLRTDHIDVMLLHSCDLATLQRGEALQALTRARDAGKVRFAGYSGDNDAAAYAAALADIAVLESSISIADQANIDKVLPVARRHNVGVIAKRPIANAAWKDPSTQPGFYGQYAQTYTDRLKQMKLSPAELGFAGEASELWPQITLRFTLSQPGVHTAIVGTTSPDNARANIAYTDQPLPAKTIEKTRQAFRSADPGGTWLGQM